MYILSLSKAGFSVKDSEREVIILIRDDRALVICLTKAADAAL
ncbi:MAG: hypothetical protein ACTS5F_01085 [Candidatus Hodgkinia cicadicola]